MFKQILNQTVPFVNTYILLILLITMQWVFSLYLDKVETNIRLLYVIVNIICWGVVLYLQTKIIVKIETEKKDTLTKLGYSQSRLDLAFDVANLGLWDWDFKTNQIIWLGKHEQLFGMKPGSFKGTYNAFRAKVHPDDILELEDRVQKSIDQNTEVEIEYRIIWDDGSEHWMKGKGRCFYDKNNQPIRMIGSVMDINERKESELKLKQNEAHFKILAESNIIGVINADLAGNINEANQAFLDTIQYSKEELIKGEINWLNLTTPEYLPQDEQLNIQLKEFKQSMSFEKEYLRKDGSRVPLLLGCTLLENNSNEVICFALDLTNIKAAERAIKESEEKFRQLAENMQNIFWMLDVKEQKIIYISPAYEKIWGYSLEDYLNNYQLIFDSIYHEDLAKFQSAFAQHLQGKTMNIEYRIICKDGRIKWIKDRSFPIINNEGEIYRVGGIAEDITERKNIELSTQFIAKASKVLASSLDYQITLKSIANLAIEYMTDWCAIDIINADETVERMAMAHPDPEKVKLGWELNDKYPQLTEKNHKIINIIRSQEYLLNPQISDDDLIQSAEDEEHLEILRSLGVKSTMILPLIARGKMLGYISFTTAESGRKYTVDDIRLAQDLSYRAALAMDNAKLYEEAQNANRLKNEFLATISHELRTPLNAMIGWIYLLRNRQFEEAKFNQGLEIIERNSKSLAALIEDLLDVSRIITGKMRLDLQPIDLIFVIKSAINTIFPTGEAKGINITIELDMNSHKILGDINRLEQIFWNLLSNSIKFTPSGGEIKIITKTCLEEGIIKIKIEDTGKGISAEFLPYVFDRFRQSDNSISRKYGGLGLGLSIVRHLVELHGGSVIAESEGLDQGATFTVNLPLIKVLN